MDTETLIIEIENAARQRGIAPSTLCQRAVKNSKLPVRLRRKGASATLRTVSRLREWIGANPPEEGGAA